MSTLPIKRFCQRSGAVFALVFAWKVALLVFSAQPVPANDAFFYDGPVVNLLLHGKYTNPSLAMALPISGAEVFCAYPPLYQAVLLGWMSLFGTSAISAMALHLVLFGIYLLVLLAIFRRLNLPAWAAQVAGAFLLAVTFHDRPDSLAHVFGLAAVYAWVRSCPPSSVPLPGSLDGFASSGWRWAMAGFSILGLATSLQVGAVYFLLLWLGMLAGGLFAGERLSVAPMLALLLVPALLVALVRFGWPHLWAGFLEHARQTPSLAGLHRPPLTDLLKMVRSVPGILAVAALLPALAWIFHTRHETPTGRSADFSRLSAHEFPKPTKVGAPARECGISGPGGAGRNRGQPLWLVVFACTLAALAIVAASMVVLTPNYVGFALYLQPLIVGGYLALAAVQGSQRRARLQIWAFLALAALGSIRAVGMTTWGLACAVKGGYPAAVHRVQTELQQCSPGNTVVLSCAFLYEAARHSEIRWIHSDWIEPARRNRPDSDWEGLLALKPSKLILTQFDYYRRYEALLAALKARPELVKFQVTNTAKVPAPDSIKPLQKVVQHLSWAPVIVTFSWK